MTAARSRHRVILAEAVYLAAAVGTTSSIERQNAKALLQAAVGRAIERITAQPAEAVASLAQDAGQPQVELTRQLDERGTRFTAQPAGVAALGSFIHETGLSRAEPGKLDELRFHL